MDLQDPITSQFSLFGLTNTPTKPGAIDNFRVGVAPFSCPIRGGDELADQIAVKELTIAAGSAETFTPDDFEDSAVPGTFYDPDGAEVEFGRIYAFMVEVLTDFSNPHTSWELQVDGSYGTPDFPSASKALETWMEGKAGTNFVCMWPEGIEADSAHEIEFTNNHPTEDITVKITAVGVKASSLVALEPTNFSTYVPNAPLDYNGATGEVSGIAFDPTDETRMLSISDSGNAAVITVNDRDTGIYIEQIDMTAVSGGATNTDWEDLVVQRRSTSTVLVTGGITEVNGHYVQTAAELWVNTETGSIIVISGGNWEIWDNDAGIQYYTSAMTVATDPVGDFTDVDAGDTNGCSSTASTADVDWFYIADTGNNAGARATVTIWRAINLTRPNTTLANLYQLQQIDVNIGAHETGTARDIESLVVDPDTGDMYLITKRTATPSVYSLAHAAYYSGTQSLVDEGTISGLTSNSTEGYTATATSASVNADGTEIVLLTYDKIYRTHRKAPYGFSTFKDMVLGTNRGYSEVSGWIGHADAPAGVPKAEGIAFDPSDDDYFYVVPEDDGVATEPVMIWKAYRNSTTTASFAQGVSSYTGTVDTYVSDGALAPNDGSGDTEVTVVDTGLVVSQMLIRFEDIYVADGGTIPDDATIIGAYLRLTLAGSGSGIAYHKLLEAWDHTDAWDDMFSTGAGVTTDDVVASTDPLAKIGLDSGAVSIAATTIWLPLPASLIEGWKTTNNGIAIIPQGTTSSNGVDIYTEDEGTPTDIPALYVVYES